jgi:tetratricopeptide (TPR) repeat protein
MGNKSKPQEEGSGAALSNSSLAGLFKQSQLDFELEFFSGILERFPDYVEVLRVMANALTLKGRIRDGLDVDQRLVRLRPRDPLAHYNLACSFALLKRTDAAVKSLRQAIELGYRDFRYMREDHDLDSIRGDPRFRQLMREYERT